MAVDHSRQTVLLRHRMPDGTWHYDWMIERHSRESGLICFRVQARIDHPRCSGFDAVKLADHRREYLTYEGEISGGRGSVERVVNGVCIGLKEAEGFLACSLDLGAGPRLLEGHQCAGLDTWRFEFLS